MTIEEYQNLTEEEKELAKQQIVNSIEKTHQTKIKRVWQKGRL